jgi:hypothetical protein
MAIDTQQAGQELLYLAPDAQIGNDPTQTMDPAVIEANQLLAQQQAEAEAAERKLVAEIMNQYDYARQQRRPYEINWYINASALRGFPDVRFNVDTDRLEVKSEPKHRQRKRINYIKTKYIARVAKYTKSPPNPTVQPATSDREDIFNARASQKALEYITRRGHIRQRYMQVNQWTPLTGKAFWAIRWDDKAIGHAPSLDAVNGQKLLAMGEIKVDFVSAFELLPADPGIELLGDQPFILRAKLVKVSDLEARFPEFAGEISGESKDNELFFYQRQIADLGTRMLGPGARAGTEDDGDSKPYVLRIERFMKPCEEYPHGHYAVVASQKLLKQQPMLPGSFIACSPENPYPFVEFVDDAAPGQFWPDAFVERLVPLQSEYNEYRSKLAENLTMHFFPKLVVYKQLGLGPNQYTTEAGEKLEINAIPGLQGNPLQFLQPQSVVGDAWNIIQHLKKEFDDVSLIYPSTTGGAGTATSGYQTSLLQEAADQVHGPAIQRNAMALEEAYMKIRHLMKQFYDIPRMISITGKNNIPEVYQFSADSIDENADVKIEPDTMMPPLRSARLDMIRQWAGDGLMGDIRDPQVLKRINDISRMGGYTEFDTDQVQRDREQAQHENIMMIQFQPLPKPQPWENHVEHWESHTDLFKSPETSAWTEEQWQQNVWHAIVHLNYINPQQAMMMASEFNMQQPLAQLQWLHSQQVNAGMAQMAMAQGGPQPGGMGPQNPNPPGPQMNGGGVSQQGPEQEMQGGPEMGPQNGMQPQQDMPQ